MEPRLDINWMWPSRERQVGWGTTTNSDWSKGKPLVETRIIVTLRKRNRNIGVVLFYLYDLLRWESFMWNIGFWVGSRWTHQVDFTVPREWIMLTRHVYCWIQIRTLKVQVPRLLLAMLIVTFLFGSWLLIGTPPQSMVLVNIEMHNYQKVRESPASELRLHKFCDSNYVPPPPFFETQYSRILWHYNFACQDYL